MSVVVWSKTNCQYCDMAKQLLKSKNITFTEKVIGNGYEAKDLLVEVANAKSVPQILVDGKLVGGYMELVKFLEK